MAHLAGLVRCGTLPFIGLPLPFIATFSGFHCPLIGLSLPLPNFHRTVTAFQRLSLTFHCHSQVVLGWHQPMAVLFFCSHPHTLPESSIINRSSIDWQPLTQARRWINITCIELGWHAIVATWELSAWPLMYGA